MNREKKGPKGKGCHPQKSANHVHLLLYTSDLPRVLLQLTSFT